MGNIRAVIFDLDGTLTVPILDFDAIRREIGLQRGPVWEAILEMNPSDRQKAEAILLRHEIDAARICRLQPDTTMILSELDRRGLAVAVLTRNCRESWKIVRDRFNFNIDYSYTREDGPMKPDPAPVIELAQRMKVKPEDSLVVGDFLFDIQAGKSAGTKTALLINHGPVPEYASIADYIIWNLRELLPIVDADVDNP